MQLGALCKERKKDKEKKCPTPYAPKTWWDCGEVPGVVLEARTSAYPEASLVQVVQHCDVV